ncbi:MAG TPA: phosphotransferase [Candidatus Limnocylindrales bacterium]|nr:phosphotransferase [Candidatus Limnocylindrales bacterium]
MPASLSAEDADGFLRARGHDPRGLAPLASGGGYWSTTFAFRENGSDYVVRFHDRRDDLEKDRLAERWRSPTLRIPHMVEIGDYGSGGYGIAERVSGSPIDDLDEAGMRRILPHLFAAMDAMRDADLAGTFGYGLWHADGRAPHATWAAALIGEDAPGERAAQRAALDRLPVGSREFDAGLARMRELLPDAPERRYLVHNDLLYYNLLADEHGLIVLDWGASIFGDFLYDAALLTFFWPYYAKRWGGIDIRAELETHYRQLRLDIPNFGARLRLCELDIGIGHIYFQATRAHPAASWTARRTADLARRDLFSSD